MNIKSTPVTLFLITFLISCSQPRLNFDRGIIPPAPGNFTGVNSSYDDYNSMIITSTAESQFSLFFSTNKTSYGGNFDFVFYVCYPSADLINAEFSIYTYKEENILVDSVNSPFNELGPYLTYDKASWWDSGSDESDRRFFYTSDINGNPDIFCEYYTLDNYLYTPSGNPIDLSGINTLSDEGYLSIHPDEYPDREAVYFTSNRDGSFDIYRALSEENKLIDQSADVGINKVEQVCSDSDDKCPFVKDDLMVFASNRNGGFGGYDLWYSTYKDNEWSLPENFGQNINTEYDEFRPVIMVTNPDEFLNNLMIFSSNRPGGSGRFDLYYVGVNKNLSFDN